MCTSDWPVETADTSNLSEPAEYFLCSTYLPGSFCFFLKISWTISNITEGTCRLDTMSSEGYLKVLFERWGTC